MIHWMVLVAVFIVCFGGVALIRFYAVSRGILDNPNARSSHSIPTPRGGGVAIVVAYLLGLLYVGYVGDVELSALTTLGVPTLIVAIIGWWDDHRPVPAKWRMLTHCVAATVCLLGMEHMPELTILGYRISSIFVTAGLAFLYQIWMINLYNFMDGIDGIAAIEAIIVCGLMAVIYSFTGYDFGAAATLLLAASVLGFFVWNFPRARIFMGDSGSGFLGLALAILSLQGALIDIRYFWAWVILLGVFIVDATFTLLHRLARGEKFYEAHRQHAYQHAATRFGNHYKVTLAVGAVTVCWLGPFAFAVAFYNLDGVVAVLIAYIPLVILAVRFKAGVALA
jgi:Fuc2NAc and GlcNAc transferase